MENIGLFWRFMLSLESIIFLAFPYSDSNVNYQKLIDKIISLELLRNSLQDTIYFLKNTNDFTLEIEVLKRDLPDFNFGDCSFIKVKEATELYYNIAIKKEEDKIEEIKKLLNSKFISELIDIYLQLWKNDFNINELKGTKRTDIDYLTSLLIMKKLTN